MERHIILLIRFATGIGCAKRFSSVSVGRFIEYGQRTGFATRAPHFQS